MAYTNYSTSSWARVASTTLAKHIREEEEAHLRSFPMFAQFEAAGNVMLNQGGAGFDWPVRYKNHTVSGNTGETERNFVRANLWKTASLEYRGLQVTDSISYKEWRENKTEEGIVKVYDGMTARLTESMKQTLPVHFFIDGSASGNELLWHGLDSLFAATQTINISTGAAQTANAADKLAYPNDTYAGLSTVLGNYGGSQESGAVWPEGVATADYDFWTPLIINYTSTAFGGAADTFAGQGDEALRYGIVHAQRNSGPDGMITTAVLSRNLYIDFENLVDNKEQIFITGDMSLRALGFRNVIVYDGVEVTWDTAVPYNYGYGYNYNFCELRCMDDTMYRVEGPEYDIQTQRFNAVVSMLSNLKFRSPRNFFQLRNVA